MTDIKTWSTAAASNTMAAPDGAPEGWSPANVNDWGRETMAAVRRWYDNAEWIDFNHTPTFSNATTFTIPTDQTGRYLARRRFRADDGGSQLYGEVVSSTYSAPNTSIVVAMDGAGLSSSLTSVALGILTPGEAEPIVRSVSAMFVSTTLTVSGAAKIGGNLSVGGTTNLQALSLSGSLNVGTQATIGTTLNVSGVLTAASDAAISGAASVGGDLRVTGNILGTGNLSVSGTVHAIMAHLSSDVSVGGALAVTGNIDANKVSASAVVAQVLSVSGAVVNANLAVGGGLTVSGVGRMGSFATVGTITAGSAIRGAQLVTDGSGSFGGAVRVTGDFNTAADVSISGGLVVTGTLNAASDVSISGQLAVAGNPIIGKAYGSQVATTAGTAVNIVTGLSSGLSQIEIVISGVSISATDEYLIQIGDSGGFETANYQSHLSVIEAGVASQDINLTGFQLTLTANTSDTETSSGILRLIRWDLAEHIWLAEYHGKTDGAVTPIIYTGFGSKTLSGEITQIRITTNGGAATFDAGEIRAQYR